MSEAQVVRIRDEHGAQCVACRTTIPQGSGAWALTEAPEIHLCMACWNRVARGGRTPRQTIYAVLMAYSGEFGGPESEADHEDYRDLQRLGLWPDDH